MSYKKT